MKTFQIVETAESTYEDPIYQVTFNHENKKTKTNNI